MPVRYLNSSVFKWPDRAEVDRAVRAWGLRAAKQHPDLVQLGYFGSYARGDWGVGSDLDLIAIVVKSNQPFERRALAWNLEDLPVPPELLVYTESEWEKMQNKSTRFTKTLSQETVWIYQR